MFLIVVNVILLIGGQFMEPSGLLVIVAPLVFPIAMELGLIRFTLASSWWSTWRSE